MKHEQHEVIAKYQQQHRKDKQHHRSKVAREARVFMHVVNGEDADQETENGDHQCH